MLTSADGPLSDAVRGLSFATTTPVATPSGERLIASLHVSDKVLTYVPATGKVATQTVAKVFLNHDHDRLDVTLALPSAHASASATTASQATHDAETARERARAVAGHGLRAPPDVTAPTTAPAVSATRVASAPSAAPTTEVIHTTANHPWLTADHGWLVAGSLHVGEPVRLLDGGTATVVALRTLPGVGPMWDLSLDSVHTFAVGNVQAVVHNTSCPSGFDYDAASQSGQRADKNGLTRAGYEYQKHMGRGELPKVGGSNLNSAGQNLLDDILTDPNADYQPVPGGRFAGGYRIIGNSVVGGRFVGAEFDSNGLFQYFGVYQ